MTHILFFTRIKSGIILILFFTRIKSGTCFALTFCTINFLKECNNHLLNSGDVRMDCIVGLLRSLDRNDFLPFQHLFYFYKKKKM